MNMGQRKGILGLLLLLLIVFMFAATGGAQTLSFMLTCGTNSSVNVDGRRWVGDTATGNNVTLSAPGIEASSRSFTGETAYEPLYRTARFFSHSLNYSFQVVPGDYLLRLHFYPVVFDEYDVNESSFGVEANSLRLVSELNVPDEIEESRGNASHLVKEYLFSTDTSVIVINFIPSIGSFGFVNAMELIREGNALFGDSVHRVGPNDGNGPLNLGRRGIQTMYRLNVGGLSISPSQDSLFYRTWDDDSSYMVNPDAGVQIRNTSNVTYANANETGVAPLLVYETARYLTNTGTMEKKFNMSWKLEVDPGFEYLVRLHFCELQYNRPNERTFRIFIDNKTAADNFDIYERAGGMNRAYHEDYVDSISSGINVLWIQLGPDTATGSAGTDALLNGLEVFKLSRNGDLAYVPSHNIADVKKTSRSLILWVCIGAGIASILILAAICMLVFCLCRRREDDTKKNAPGWRPLFLNGSILSSTINAKGSVLSGGQFGTVRSGRRFTLTEIRSATNNFDDSLVIGVGGFGKVYKGEIDDTTLVAVKRSNPQSQQGLKEFETEIEMLSKLRHRHLVSLIGFCDEQNEMILVYEYMSNGTLRGHLFGSDLPSLSWKQRLEACIGAARGLHYLHTGSDRGIIHRDVKTTNILLDENFVAKMADFGLSKTGPSLEHTHVSTAVKGSFGYLDPEYFRRQQLTEKSDVYSFGVVLFEVVCARPVINPALPREQINLAEWAMKWQRKKSLESIIDPKLSGMYSSESLARFGEIAEKCLADEGKLRPTMGEVLWHLEYVLQLQDAWIRSNNVDESVTVEVQNMGPIDEEESVVVLESADSSDDGTEEHYEPFTKTDKASNSIAVGVDESPLMVSRD